MSNEVKGLIMEVENEAKTTRRLLERVPQDKLGWKPHTKSMTLGQLALHVASIPGNVANRLIGDSLDVKTVSFEAPTAESVSEILSALDNGIAQAKSILGDLGEKATATFRLMAGDKEVFAMPRVAVARNIMLNHWYHHRGQLTVYLRLLDVPLPVTYGRSADENPFA